jgi:hypothetical protein
MAKRGRLEALREYMTSGVPATAVAGLFGERESGEQVSNVFTCTGR